jgi:hypothetical protein
MASYKPMEKNFGHDKYVEKYEKKQIIGEGTYGVVYSAIC